MKPLSLLLIVLLPLTVAVVAQEGKTPESKPETPQKKEKKDKKSGEPFKFYEHRNVGGDDARLVKLYDRFFAGTERWRYVMEPEASLAGVTNDEFHVFRDGKEFAAFLERTKFADPYKDDPIDFGKDMLIAAIGEPKPYKRNFQIHRALELPDHFEYYVTSYDRKKETFEKDVTPLYILRVERSSKPVHFYKNHDFARGENIEPLQPGTHFESVTFDIPYAVYIPEKLKTPAPMAVFLHGSTISGSRQFREDVEGNVSKQALADKYGFVMLVPSSRNGYYWTQEYDYGAIFDAIERVCARYPIDRSNIFIGGGSAGGHTSYHIGLEYRDRWKGFFAMCGRMNPEAVTDAMVERAKDMPVIVIAGEKDDTVPLKAIEPGLERLRKAGAKLEHHVIKDWGHDLGKSEEAMTKLFEWLYKTTYGKTWAEDHPETKDEPVRNSAPNDDMPPGSEE